MELATNQTHRALAYAAALNKHRYFPTVAQFNAYARNPDPKPALGIAEALANMMSMYFRISPESILQYVARVEWVSHPKSAKELRMQHIERVTALIEPEGDGYVSLCPELDIASQGDTIEQARANLQEALGLFFETAGPEEITDRFHREVYVTQLDIAAE